MLPYQTIVLLFPLDRWKEEQIFHLSLSTSVYFVLFSTQHPLIGALLCFMGCKRSDHSPVLGVQEDFVQIGRGVMSSRIFLIA